MTTPTRRRIPLAAGARLARPRRHAPLRPFGDRGEAPRRPMAAGRVIVVGVVCLMLGWLFNAQGIKKTASSQSFGWQRDVSLFFAEPMADISHSSARTDPASGSRIRSGAAATTTSRRSSRARPSLPAVSPRHRARHRPRSAHRNRYGCG